MKWHFWICRVFCPMPYNFIKVTKECQLFIRVRYAVWCLTVHTVVTGTVEQDALWCEAEKWSGAFDFAEPGILVMYNSMKQHLTITATLLDFLCRVSEDPGGHFDLSVHILCTPVGWQIFMRSACCCSTYVAYLLLWIGKQFSNSLILSNTVCI